MHAHYAKLHSCQAWIVQCVIMSPLSIKYKNRCALYKDTYVAMALYNQCLAIECSYYLHIA